MRYLIFCLLFVLAGCAATLTSIEKDIDTLKEEAASGKIESAHALCYRYSKGYNAPLDDELAFLWCSNAAATQRPQSVTLLANLYFAGRGTKQNYRQSAKLYYFASERGINKAMFMLYLQYKNGLGVEKDPTEAKYYLNRAASRHYEPAKKELQRLLLSENES